MLAFRIGPLNNQIDETARNRDELRRNGTAADELLRLADHEAMRGMRRLGKRQRIAGNRLFFHGTIAVGVTRAGRLVRGIARGAWSPSRREITRKAWPPRRSFLVCPPSS